MAGATRGLAGNTRVWSFIFYLHLDFEVSQKQIFVFDDIGGDEAPVTRGADHRRPDAPRVGSEQTRTPSIRVVPFEERTYGKSRLTGQRANHLLFIHGMTAQQVVLPTLKEHPV